MKICILTSGHNIFDSRIYYKEILSLKKICSDIYLIAPGEKNFTTEEGIKVLCFKRRKNWHDRIRPMKEMFELAMKINADIYHAHEPDSYQVAVKLKKNTGARIIYDSHEYYPESFSEHFKIGRNIIKRGLYFYEKSLVKKADYIITVNNLLESKFKKYNKNVAVLPNYPILSLAKQEVQKTAIPTFVYVGGISEERGILKILESIRYVKSKYKYVFIGPFWDETIKMKVKSYIAQYLKDENIKFTGAIPHTEVPKYLKSATAGFVLLQPSNWRYVNSEPIKLFEYMLNKLPVIASDFPMLRSIVQSCKCGMLVDPEDSRAIAGAIDYLAENYEIKCKMGVNGYESIKEKYNWESLTPVLDDIYYKLGNF